MYVQVYMYLSAYIWSDTCGSSFQFITAFLLFSPLHRFRIESGSSFQLQRQPTFDPLFILNAVHIHLNTCFTQLWTSI